MSRAAFDNRNSVEILNFNDLFIDVKWLSWTSTLRSLVQRAPGTLPTFPVWLQPQLRPGQHHRPMLHLWQSSPGLALQDCFLLSLSHFPHQRRQTCRSWFSVAEMMRSEMKQSIVYLSIYARNKCDVICQKGALWSNYCRPWSDAVHITQWGTYNTCLTIQGLNLFTALTWA